MQRKIPPCFLRIALALSLSHYSGNYANDQKFMKTWIGLLLALIGLGLGLVSTVFTNISVSEPERASIFGFDITSITENSPSIVGFSLLVLIASFCIIFSSKKKIRNR